MSRENCDDCAYRCSCRKYERWAKRLGYKEVEMATKKEHQQR